MQMSRNTVQQDIICNTVKGMDTHPSPDEVYEKVRKDFPTIGRATVYRVLNKLAQKGEIKKVVLPNTADRFDFRTDEHIHIRCKYCNKVFDVDFHDDAELKRCIDIMSDYHKAELNGFEVTGVNISFEGICRDCLADRTNEKK